MKSLLILLTGLALMLMLGNDAEAGGPKVITKVPYTIVKPGQYQLGRNLDYTGTTNAITIEADDVTLDLSGYTLNSTGKTSQTSQTAGIFASNRKNLVIRNGTVRGFFRGVYLETSDTANGAHLVEEIRADRCTFLGILVKGDGSMVRRNRVTTVDGAASTFIRFGMDLSGNGVVVMDNQIFDVRTDPNAPNHLAYGINITASSSPQITGNVITRSTGSFSCGIRLSSCVHGIVTRNQISEVVSGIDFENCDGTVYRDNTTTATTSKYSVAGGSPTNGGGNL